MLARLVRVYGLDPERVPEMPTYLLMPLINNLPALIAEEQLQEITAALTPHIEVHYRRNLMNSLERSATPLHPSAPREPIEIIEHNPELAAAYFESLGITVQTPKP